MHIISHMSDRVHHSCRSRGSQVLFAGQEDHISCVAREMPNAIKISYIFQPLSHVTHDMLAHFSVFWACCVRTIPTYSIESTYRPYDSHHVFAVEIAIMFLQWR